MDRKDRVHTARTVMAYSQQVREIAPHGRQPKFFYTIGNASHGLPELLLIGNASTQIGYMIMEIFGGMMRERGRALPEGLIDINWTFPFKIRKAGLLARLRYTVQAGEFIGSDDYEVLQIMFCDKAGRYPDEKGCELKVPMP
jgi:hypothetical protein|nr:DUF4262 domain-containing protein [Neorhizobium tomejilense]